MVEFLTGSTTLSALVSNLPDLLVFVFVTVPNYALSALLIREAIIAWKKSWATLLSFGIAYGAVNEGLMAKTYFTFQSLSPALGTASGVGHLFGINWPWVTGITLFHMIVSISVPVALSFLIFPDTASQRLLGRKSTIASLGLLVFQIALWTPILLTLVPGLHQVLPLLVLPIAIVFVFTYVARRLPAPEQGRRLHGSISQPISLAIVSIAFFLVTFAPILRFFAFPVIPIVDLYAEVYRLDATGILATLYPMVLAALAIAFFVRYSLSESQVLGIVAGVLFIPMVSALAPFDLPAGAPIAALIYAACMIAAWIRIHSRDR